MSRYCNVCKGKISKYTNKSGICRKCKIEINKEKWKENWARCKNCSKKFQGRKRPSRSGYCKKCCIELGILKGKRRSKEQRKNISEAQKKRFEEKPESHWAFGKTKENNVILKQFSERMKINNPTKNPEVLKKISNTLRTKHGPGSELRRRQAKTISENIANGKIVYKNSRFKRGRYFSKKNKESNVYESGSELKRMKELDKDENVVHWTKRHKIIIEYVDEVGILRNYIPDFLITYSSNSIVLEEVKGYIPNKKKFICKCRATKEYCKTKNIEFKVNIIKR